jgi:hypothetical protein
VISQLPTGGFLTGMLYLRVGFYSGVKELSIFADSVYYEICVLHFVACLLLLGGDYTSYHGPIDSNTLWMVPTLYATTFGNEASSSYHYSAAGYDESSNSWEPYKALMHVDKLHDYLREHKMRALIPREHK